MEWIDQACPTVRSLLEELASPRPWVPWEYRSLVADRGHEWLEAAWSLEVQVPSACPDPARFVHEAASLGVGHFLVEPALNLSVSVWRESLPLGREWLGQPLRESVEAFLASRFPLAVASDGIGGLLLPGEGIAAALAEVLA